MTDTVTPKDDPDGRGGYHTRPTDKITPMPAVGRIVHYWPKRNGALKGQPYPAVITHVWTPTVVNLNVFLDATYSLDDGKLIPSVELFDPRPGENASDEQKLGKWSWPPRV